MLNYKQLMLSIIQGQEVSVLPWVPRLDLWYRANRMAGTLPKQYRNSDLFKIAEGIGCGYHAVVPDFQDIRTELDDVDRALGIYNLSCMPCHTALDNIERIVNRKGDTTYVRYETPAGQITTAVIYNEQMRRSGITIKHVQEYAFKDEKDYAPLNWIFQNARVVPNYAGYDQFASKIGDRGMAAGFVNICASGMHWILYQLMHLDTFYYQMNDNKARIEELAENIQIFLDKLVKAVAQSSADVIFVGGNYDSSVTYPPFFKQYIVPSLKKNAELLHSHNKFLLTHTDGENTGLLEHYLDSGIDIADSICPAPMTKLSFGEIRSVFEDRITIMGGIPSVILLKSSMRDEDFKVYLHQFFNEIGGGRKLILGISDTTPPGADFDRILRIGDLARSFAPA